MIFRSKWVDINISIWKINSSVRLIAFICIFNHLSRFKLTFFISVCCWIFNTILCYLFWFQCSCFIKNSLCVWFVLFCWFIRKFRSVLFNMAICIFYRHTGSPELWGFKLLVFTKEIILFILIWIASKNILSFH